MKHLTIALIVCCHIIACSEKPPTGTAVPSIDEITWTRDGMTLFDSVSILGSEVRYKGRRHTQGGLRTVIDTTYTDSLVLSKILLDIDQNDLWSRPSNIPDQRYADLDKYRVRIYGSGRVHEFTHYQQFRSADTLMERFLKLIAGMGY